MTIAQIARNNLLSLSQSSLMVGTRYEQLHGQNQGGRLVAWMGGSRAASSMPLVRRSAMFRFDIIFVWLDGVEMAMDDVINVRRSVNQNKCKLHLLHLSAVTSSFYYRSNARNKAYRS